MSEKIQKLLANTGLGSRRQIESWIQAGRITINGQIAQLGKRITYQDQVTLDGKKITLTPSQNMNTRVLLYHKPEGELCTRHDPEGRPTIFNHLPELNHGRWINVGRLDFNTSGLLLFTNDGELAHQLMHPSNQLEREYAVRVFGAVTAEHIAQLKKGIQLPDGLAQFSKIKEIGGSNLNHWYHVTVKQGRNRVVRRMWEAIGLTVSRLIRIRFACIILPKNLKSGQFQELTLKEITLLKKEVVKKS